MQPRSIKLFTILFFLSNAVALAGEYAFFDRYVSDMMFDPETEFPIESEELLTTIMLGAYAVFIGLSLLLWYSITEKRSKIGKWSYVVLTVVSVLSYLFPDQTYVFDETLVFGLATTIMVASAGVLFRTDAKKWFDRVEDIDPEVFS